MGGAHQHTHAHGAGASVRRLAWTIALNVLLTIAQVVAGLLSGSLALIADALHNLNDAASLGISLVAQKVATRRADQRRTFGYRRAQVIGALINLTTLIVIGLMLVYQAIERWISPQPVDGWVVIVVAGIALLVDIATAVLIATSPGQNLNLRAVFVHNLTDALASVGVIVAGVLILLLGWTWTDPLLTLLIAGYVLYQGFTMIGEAIHILLESVPENVDLDELVASLTKVDGVRDVHHVHVWELDGSHRAMEAHIVIARENAGAMERIKRDIKQRLHDRFEIGHTTLEFEYPANERGPADHATEIVPEH